VIPKIEQVRKVLAQFLPYYYFFAVWFMLLLLFVNLHVVLWNTGTLRLKPSAVVFSWLLTLPAGAVCIFAAKARKKSG